MRRTLVFSILLLTPVLSADTYPRQPGLDALHYNFSLTLSDASDEITGTAAIDLRVSAPGVRSLALDLVAAKAGKGMIVDSVLASSNPARFQHSNDRLTIDLSPPSEPGARLRVEVRYHGVPAGGLRIMKNKFGDRVFFSENWPNNARHWLPMIDHPYDKATSEFAVTAPAHYQVIANGLLQMETDLPNGLRLTHWKQSVPIASWLNAVGVARFGVHHAGKVNGVELQTWVYHQEQHRGPAWFEPTSRKAMEFFSSYIGPYSYEKLANIQAAGFQGGTEHASAIFYGEKSILDRPGTNLIAHEIAHQWFGNSVTEKDWDDVWLSEGFATYFTLLFLEHSEGRDAFVDGLQRSRQSVFGMEKKLTDAPIQHRNLADMRRVLNGLIYQKGGWTLHMLRKQVGTETFWRGIREYYAKYRDSSATTGDFRRVMEEASGQDLGWFFTQWLTRPASPAVEGAWRYDAATKSLAIELNQTQPGDAYRLPLEIAVTAAGETKVHELEGRSKQERFNISLDREPSAVVLDPGTWTLIDVKRFARASAATQ